MRSIKAKAIRKYIKAQNFPPTDYKLIGTTMVQTGERGYYLSLKHLLRHESNWRKHLCKK